MSVCLSLGVSNNPPSYTYDQDAYNMSISQIKLINSPMQVATLKKIIRHVSDSRQNQLSLNEIDGRLLKKLLNYSDHML